MAIQSTAINNGSEFGFLSTWTLQLAGTNYNTQDRQGIVSTVSFPVVVTVRTEGDTSLVRVTGQPRTGVSFERLVSWRSGDDHALVTSTIRNASAAAITGVKLLESHNPDPAYAFETANDVTRGGRVAVGTAFGLSMGLATGDSRATLSVEGAAALDGLLAVNPDDVLGTPVDPAGATADTALNLAFNFGTVAAGGSATGTFAILFGNGQAAVESLYDRLDIAPVVWDDVDTYAITADAGQRLLFQTRTPGTAAGDVPDVRLELLDQAGSVLASDDNGAADGRNAVLAHQFVAAGTYYLRVSASPAATTVARGSYVLGTAAPTIGTSGAFVGVATTYGTASGTTQISVTGSLLEGAITATAPGHFEVSSDGVTFGPTATFSPVGGSVSGTAYVRLSATASAGTYSGDVSFASSNATGVTVALPTGTVSPKALSITGLSATSRVYDGTTAASITGTPAYDGLVAADAGSFTVVKGTAVAAFADPNAGEGKTVTVTGYQAPSSNYTVADPSLTATITRRAASITGAAAARRRVYDGSTGVAVSGGSLAGILAGDAVTLSAAGAVGTVASPNAGTNLPVTVTGYSISGPSAANYDVVQPTGLVTTITAKPVTITGAKGLDRAYDRTVTVAIDTSAASIVGLIPGDAVAIGGAPVGTMTNATVGANKPLTVTGLALTGAAAGNYGVAQPTGLTASISQAALTIVGVSGGSRVYSGAAVRTATVTGTPTLSGVFAGDTVGIVSGTYSFADGNAGTGKPITAAGFAINGTSSANYRLAAQPAPTPGTITPKALTITGLVGVDRVYDGTTGASFAGTPVYSGLVAADGLATTPVSGTPAATFADKNAGALKTVTVRGFTGPTANYTVTAPTVKATITKAPVTITGVSGGSRPYAGAAVRTATVTGTPTLSGVISGDTLAVTVGTYSFADGNAGVDKPITAAGFSITGASLANYVLAGQPQPTPGTITPKALTITGLVGVSRVYDGTTAATFTGTPAYSGLVAADGLAATPVSGTPVATFADKNAGTLKNVTVNGYTAPTANYSVTAPTLKASITQATVTITGVSAVGRTYDGTTAVQLAGGTAVGLLAADVAAGSVALGATGATGKMATAAASATAKPVTVTGFALEGADAANYKLTQPTGVTVLIAKRNVTVTGLTANGKTYNNSTTATVSGTATLQNVVAGESLSLGGTPVFRFAQAGVGTNVAVTTTGYTLVAGPGAAVANYNLVMPVLSADITQAVLTVKANSFTVARGAAIPALTYTITGLAAGDLAANTYAGLPSLATSATRTSLAGAYVITVAPGTLSLLTTTGKKGGNYVFAFVDGSVTIL
ncbi:MAG: beta strand repeat-containing protein [Planctomycetaceae bacterium]